MGERRGASAPDLYDDLRAVEAERDRLLADVERLTRERDDARRRAAAYEAAAASATQAIRRTLMGLVAALARRSQDTGA